MSIELATFSKSYEQIVNQIKIIKQSVVRITQNNVLNYAAEGILIQKAKIKVQNWIQQMQRSYLDPQTACRLEIVKQQLSSDYQKYQSLKNSGERSVNSNEILQSQEELDGENNLFAFDNETQAKIQRQKQKQLEQAHRKMLNIHNITEETKIMTQIQGDNLDIIDTNLSTTYSNVVDSNKELEEARKEQKKSRNKYFWLVGVGVVAIVLAIIFIFVI